MKARTNSKQFFLCPPSALCIVGGLRAFVFFVASLASAQTTATWKSEIRIGQFECHCDFDLSQAQRDDFEFEKLVSTLQELPQEIASTLSLPTSDAPIHVVLFQERDEYLRYMRNYFPQIPERRAIFIQDRGPGMLFTYIHKDFFVDLRHEMTHALLNRSGKPLPLWLDEGIAEYFEDDSRGLRSSNRATLIHQFASGEKIPNLEVLEACHSLAELSDDNYEQAWGWVHFLLHRNVETHNLLVDVLRRQLAGEAQPPLSRRVAVEFPNCSEMFVEHFRQVQSESNPTPFVQQAAFHLRAKN